MSLHRTVAGRPDGPTLVLAHGFSQNVGCWGAFGEALEQDHRVVRVDAPGHGGSIHDDADLWEAGRLLGEVAGAAILVGYSMGGRMALHTALDSPGSVCGLVLIGATAGLDDPDERSARRAADQILSERLISIGLPAFIDEWLAGPLFRSIPPEAACREQRLANRPAGLAASLRRCGTGCQDPLWSRLGEIDVPVLVIAGELDPKFTATGRRLVDAIGADAQLAVVGGAGHAVHLERPSEAADLISAFVGRCSGPERLDPDQAQRPQS